MPRKKAEPQEDSYSQSFDLLKDKFPKINKSIKKPDSVLERNEKNSNHDDLKLKVEEGDETQADDTEEEVDEEMGCEDEHGITQARTLEWPSIDLPLSEHQNWSFTNPDTDETVYDSFGTFALVPDLSSPDEEELASSFYKMIDETFRSKRGRKAAVGGGRPKHASQNNQHGPGVESSIKSTYDAEDHAGDKSRQGEEPYSLEQYLEECKQMENEMYTGEGYPENVPDFPQVVDTPEGYQGFCRARATQVRSAYGEPAPQVWPYPINVSDNDAEVANGRFSPPTDWPESPDDKAETLARLQMTDEDWNSRFDPTVREKEMPPFTGLTPEERLAMEKKKKAQAAARSSGNGQPTSSNMKMTGAKKQKIAHEGPDTMLSRPAGFPRNKLTSTSQGIVGGIDSSDMSEGGKYDMYNHPSVAAKNKPALTQQQLNQGFSECLPNRPVSAPKNQQQATQTNFADKAGLQLLASNRQTHSNVGNGQKVAQAGNTDLFNPQATLIGDNNPTTRFKKFAQSNNFPSNIDFTGTNEFMRSDLSERDGQNILVSQQTLQKKVQNSSKPVTAYRSNIGEIGASKNTPVMVGQQMVLNQTVTTSTGNKHQKSGNARQNSLITTANISHGNNGMEPGNISQNDQVNTTSQTANTFTGSKGLESVYRVPNTPFINKTQQTATNGQEKTPAKLDPQPRKRSLSPPRFAPLTDEILDPEPMGYHDSFFDDAMYQLKYEDIDIDREFDEMEKEQAEKKRAEAEQQDETME